MRILGLDVGERRVGIAISDPTGTVARPLQTLVRSSRSEDFAAIAALVAEHDVGLVVVGSDAETVLAHEYVGRYANDAWDYRGRVSADEALRLLARARLVLAPFVDGLTGRRTSAMASLSCGSRLITSSGHLYDPAFDEGPAPVADSKELFSHFAHTFWEVEDKPADRAQRLSWYRDHCSATKLDGRLLEIVVGGSGN